MQKAFYYMFYDNKFILKYFMIFSFIFVPYFIFINIKSSLFFHNIHNYFIATDLFAIIYIFIFIYLSGYWIDCIKVIMDNDKHIILPYINVKNNFITGIKWNVAFLIFILLLTCFYLFIILLANIPFMKYFFIILAVLLFIASYIMQISFIWIFAKTNNIYSYTKISDALGYINNNRKSYFFAVLLYLLVHLLLNTIVKLVIHNFAYTTLVMATIPYLMFLTAYAVAKSIKTNELKYSREEK